MLAGSVHPHWRGEHRAIPIENIDCTGSSPLAWGTSAQGAITASERRFIPTGVGNISADGSILAVGTVHPHWRGEHFFGDRLIRLRNGSSPLAWGTCSRCSRCFRLLRFIPTGVGNMSH